MYKFISSKDNQQLKLYASLHDSKKASKLGLVFIEGVRLCEDCLTSGIIPKVLIFTTKQKTAIDDLKAKYSLTDEIEYVELNDDCFNKLASTVNPQGIAMVIEKTSCNIVKADSSVTLPVRNGKNIYVVLENLQDPGNLGTILRMADAFNFTSVLMTSNSVDPFNEKVLRASMGSVWHLPVMIYDDIDSICNALDKAGVNKYAAHLKGTDLRENEFVFPAAFFIGNEGKGLTDFASDKCDYKIKIPMPGKAESLNAASAASIIGYLMSVQ